tara:strand:- start:1092 stop:1343 length:252 start_codon:yes stop_codon:yes gene_type:complete
MNNKRKLKIRKWFRDLKNKSACEICGESHPSCLEFHHLKKKDNIISKMVASGYAIDTIQKEMAKCQIVCANCHRKIHYLDEKK